MYIGVTLQMDLLVSTVLSCLLSAGQLIVSVLSLLVPSAAARYKELLGNVLSIKKEMDTLTCCVLLTVFSLFVGSIDGGHKHRERHLTDFK